MSTPKFQPGEIVQAKPGSNHPVKTHWKVEKAIPMPSGYVYRGFAPAHPERKIYEHEVFLDSALTKGGQ